MNLGKYKDCTHYLLKQKKIKSKLDEISILCATWFRQKCLRRFELPYIEMFITTKCNLRCDACSNLIPDMKDSEHIDKDVIFKTIDKLLSNIDSLYRLKLHGGEVFLHPQLSDIVEFTGKKKKIVSLRLATNGTIIPDNEVLDTIKKFNFVVQISDYSLPNTRTDELIKLLNQKDVRYSYSKDKLWRNMNGLELRDSNRRSDCTIARCTSLIDEHIHICSRAAMMDKLYGIKSKCVNVFQDRKKFQKETISLFNDLNINACRYCDGDTEFALPISAGAQRSTAQ